MQSVARVWRRLTTPAHAGEEPGLRRRAKAIAVALVIGIPLGVAGVASRIGLDFGGREAVSGLIATAMLALAYALFLGRGVWAAGWVAAFGACVSAGTLLVLGDYDTLMLAYMGLSLVIAGAVLRIRDLVVVAVLNALALGLVPVVGDTPARLEELPDASAYLFVLGSAVVLGVWYRRSQLIDGERRYNELFRTVFPGIAVVRDGTLVHANHEFAELLGVDPVALRGARALQLFADDSRAIVGAALRRPSSRARAVRTAAGDGGVRELDLVGHAFPYEGTQATFLGVRDITRLREAERRAALSQRVATIGTLAASIAHDINNPLAYVLTNLELARESLQKAGNLDDAQVGESIRIAIDGVTRIGQTVSDLGKLVRAGHGGDGTANVHAALDLAIRIAGNQIRHEATLVSRLGEQLPPVPGTETELAQVFVNLLVNAAQAMAELPRDESEIHVETSVGSDERVLVRIRDTGPGIPRQLHGRIFDPFFTTKHAADGTGLGLPACREILASLGGQIRVESELGAGTTFSVFLPVARALASRDRPAARTVDEARRVLVIDDEADIREVLVRALCRHEVTAVASAPEALQRCLEASYDVVLCDLMMPGMSGQEFYETLRSRDPAQAKRVVFVSGGALTPGLETFVEGAAIRMIAKPFSVAEVRDVVARLDVGNPGDD